MGTPSSRLAELCAQIVDCPHSTPQWTESGVVVLRSENIKGGRLDLSRPSYTDEQHYALRTRRAVPVAGDLVITREAPMGEVCIIPPGLRCCLGQRMVLLRPNPAKVDARYLLYALQSPAIQHEIRTSEGTGSTVSNLRIPLLEALPVPTPPLAVQSATATILGALDAKIELNRRMSETLEAMARALFKSWFVDFDPVGAKAQGHEVGPLGEVADLFPSETVDSPDGLVPLGWQTAEIGQVADVIDCLHSRKPERAAEGRPMLQLKNIRDDGHLDLSDTYLITDQDYARWTSRIEAREGDCVVTNVGRVGAAAQVPAGLRAALGRNMTAVRVRVDFPYPTFLIESLLSDAMRAEIGRRTDAGTIMEALNVRSIPKLRFIAPPRALVERFEALTRPMRARTEGLIEESQTLAGLRDSLLTKLISGELRVPDAERVAVEAGA